LRDLAPVSHVRQSGMIAGIEINPAAATGAKICLAARRHGLLTRPIVNTLVLMPPLCVSTDELGKMVNAIRMSIIEVCGK